MQLDRNGLEILDREECLRLLALATLGRIGFTSGALPTVLPVNFHLDRERILVHTARGGRLEAALKNAVVAFEADEFDPVDHSGWSVAVTGVTSELSGATLTHWAPVGGAALVAISTEVMSGRRIRTGERRDLPFQDGSGGQAGS